MAGLLDQLDLWLTLMGVAVTLAAGFLVFNAFAMSIAQRQRQIGALRSLGMTRRQVMRVILLEALITGGLGTLLGLILGPLLGHATIAAIVALIGQDLFVFDTGGVVAGNSALAVLLGLGVTTLSVLIPARRATRVSPLAALRDQTITPRAGQGGIGKLSTGLLVAGSTVAGALFAYLAVAPPGVWVNPPWDTVLTVSFACLWLASLALLLPALLGGMGQWVRRPLTRLWGATGRLIADNLRRARGRVALTILTLTVALALIVGMTGLIQFFFNELMGPKITGSIQLGAWLISEIDFVSGMGGYAGLESLTLSPEIVQQVESSLGERAQTMLWHFVIAPELSMWGSTYFSFIMDPYDVRAAGDVFFTFTEGSWETALPRMSEGCGVLVAPAIAIRNDVWVGGSFEVTGAAGPVSCTVAGVGSPYVGASIIGVGARDAFQAMEPMAMLVWPAPGVNRDDLGAELAALIEDLPDAEMRELKDMADMQMRMVDILPDLFNALLLLAIVAAALGVVNTTVISVAERRRELGLLRAVGATRRQVSAVVAGEAALMGLIGGALGLVAGVGIVAILAVTYGGNAWGVPDLDLWPAAWRAVRPSLFTGLVGLVSAPFICAAAAWLPLGSILRGSAIETMKAPRQERILARHAGWIPAGIPIRARFVLGTGLLLLAVLAAIIAVVTRHERAYTEDQARDMLTAMIETQAGMLELILPDDAQTIDLSDLPAGQFDADDLLRVRSLMEGVSDQGLEAYVVADREGVVVLSLDPREMGMLLPEVALPGKTEVLSERDDGAWRMHATTPVHAGGEDGQAIGTVRMTVNLTAAQAFIGRTRDTLWLAGGGIVTASMAVSWILTRPLSTATRQLAAHAARVARGEYVSLGRRRGRLSWLIGRTSLRLRLTIVMVAVVVLLVGMLELSVVPIERHHLERTLREAMSGTVEWLGEVLSESQDTEFFETLGKDSLFGLDQDESFDLEKMLGMSPDIDLARLQELGERMQSDNAAYVALVDEGGVIQFSDQISLIGETVPIPDATRIEDARWRGEEIWVISTPLREGREGGPFGALRVGVRRTAVETFLDESRTLFRLTGVIAVLGGVLLAQAIGGTVTAPVRQLAASVRRVGQGDLDVRFEAHGGDELATLARAFDRMTDGLREREWLRDMFGRFVSHEVAEAIRTGEVRLAGENRVVSVLFCDIQGFAQRSAGSAPEEIVGLLNAYLPLVVEAAQRHEGMVNKFGGESTLIVYGAPRELHESAYCAVMTALEIRANLRGLNASLAARGEQPVRIGVGINTGHVLAGAVGPEERQEYTVIGDAVNLASRIEALTREHPAHDILISGWTYGALGTRRREFDLMDLGEVQIRGKLESVHVWAVAGIKR